MQFEYGVYGVMMITGFGGYDIYIYIITDRVITMMISFD